MQINSEKKLTEEAVKKLYQIVQEKKPKTGVLKNASETKRLEKEHKRLQLELSKVNNESEINFLVCQQNVIYNFLRNEKIMLNCTNT